MRPRRPPRACRAARALLPLLYYGDLQARERAGLLEHLEACGACAEEESALRTTLGAAVPDIVFPGEAGVDWNEFARSTAARARAVEAAGRAGTRPLPRFGPGWLAALGGGAALAAALVIALVLLEAWTRPGSRPAPAGPAMTASSMRASAEALEDRLARQGAVRYLNDSRSIFLTLSGTASPCRRSDGRYDLTLDKEKSRQLLRRKNLYESDLGAPEDQRLAMLMRQLESLLMQVAALDDCASARQIHDLREQIDTRQILLRIDLLIGGGEGRRGRADVV